jgi:opacity protein-like surface antigen
MKSMFRKIISLAVLGGCIGTASSRAQPAPAPPPPPPPPPRAEETGFYIQGDLGGQWTHDVKLNEFFGVPLAPDSKIKLDTGIRAGVSGGYQFCSFFALEGELGFMGNHINSITSATYIHDAYLANMPFLVNAKFMLPNRTIVTPFIGAGVGFSQTILDADNISILDTAGGVTTMHGNDWDTVFAWQAFAGLKFRVNDYMGIAVEYRYFTADPASWHAEFASGTPSGTISFGRTETHAVSAAFVFRF